MRIDFTSKTSAGFMNVELGCHQDYGLTFTDVDYKEEEYNLFEDKEVILVMFNTKESLGQRISAIPNMYFTYLSNKNMFVQSTHEEIYTHGLDIVIGKVE